MKYPLAVILALATTPAIAWDNDPASFRADPQAWVRTVVLPGCNAPKPKEQAVCACMVPMLAQQVTEADVARVNEPGADKAIGGKAMAAGITCAMAALISKP